MDPYTPHKALLALHRLTDEALYPVFGPMDLDLVTESVMCVDRDDLRSLAGSEPQTALVTLDDNAAMPALVIIEPALAQTVIERIWSVERSAEQPLTGVETALIQQLLADVCRQWRSGWSNAAIETLPSLTLVSPLGSIDAEMVDGPWYVARTLVSGDGPAGVLLFCYPAGLIEMLAAAQQRTSWRSRLERGMDDESRELLRYRLQQLPALPVPLPVQGTVMLPVRALDQLERGDVIALDGAQGELELNLLDRKIRGQLAQSDGQLCIRVTDPGTAAPAANEQHNDFSFADAYPVE